ncbi:MAG: hypothetical protein K2Y39_07180 [Candidatus Obscuribacterales bacterium]|nr:hypothetical protein [Candidatus Obscuribacterales bacterium]
MFNVNPPRTVKQEDERFSFMPPPLASSDKGKSFDACMSVSDIPMAIEEETCSSLLTKMADLVSENQRYEHIEAVVPNANLFVPQVPSYVEQMQHAQTERLAAQPVQPILQDLAAQTFAQELAQVYAAHMPQVFAEMEAQRQTSPNYTAPINSFISHEDDSDEGVVTVVDFTGLAATASAVKAPAAKQTHSGLNSILKSRVAAPVNQAVSSSWFS